MTRPFRLLLALLMVAATAIPAAAQTGDHALAMSSYARALELLSLLLEEVEP